MSMVPQPPPGQGPIDPRGAFAAPPAPGPALAPGPQPGPGPGAAPPPAGGPRLQFGAPLPPQYGPPMMMPPPPMFYPPPPAPHRERSVARALFTTLMTTVFGISLALNVYLLLASGLSSSASGAPRQETVVEGAADH